MQATAMITGEIFPSQAWVDDWTRVINADDQLARLGKWFDARVLFDFGGDKDLVKFSAGRVESVLAQPIWDKPWDFCIRATLDCWQKSLQSPPPPFYQDIFGMMWNHGMTLEGDVVKAMQNIRALKLVLASMKRAGLSSGVPL
jgi:hypothetical protein